MAGRQHGIIVYNGSPAVFICSASGACIIIRSGKNLISILIFLHDRNSPFSILNSQLYYGVIKWKINLSVPNCFSVKKL